ncbi:unnamed protein product [Schistosoma rodhaini]|uniref:Reverse transcriptase domain-containing protein n=1 Tax=Schistosoma rodhaini TaxID=6188 RepID=A0AA85GE36_9TREM|nr:unnamed protein product [Schistosoma rodhaini]
MNVNFKFNGDIFRQTDGVAMGSPLGPILADIFLAKLENGHLKKIIQEFKFYCRYMDDTFILCKDNISQQDVLRQFNEVHPAIQFTSEEESDGRLAFLDVLLTKRSDGSLRRNMNRKSTWTGQYTHFLSFVPLQYKRNLIKTLSYRIRTICSADVVDNELNTLHNALRENGYPRKFIIKYMIFKVKIGEFQTVKKKSLFMRLQFRGDAAGEILAQRLRRSIQKSFNAGELRLVFSTRPMVTPRLKDEVPRMTTSFCIYQFDCSCGASYIGRSSRNLHFRAREHLPAWLSKGLMRKVNSSILAHLVQTGHSASINQSFSIIYRVSNFLPKLVRLKVLQTAEAVAIRMKKPELCVQKKYLQPLLLPWPTTRSINEQSS